MYWEVPCQSCGQNLKVRAEHVGRRVRCPYCRKEFVGKPPQAGPLPRTVLPASAAKEERAQASAQAFPSLPPQAPARPFHAHSSALIKPPGTNVSLLLTGAIGLAATALFYILAVWPLEKTYFGQLLGNRSWIQHCIMFLSFWAATILVFKSRKIGRQKESILFDMLPSEISNEIRPDNVDAFRSHISALPCDPRDSFLMSRCLRAIDHFKSRGSVQEVSSLLNSQGEIDLAAVDTSYSMVKIFVWAIPILGFVGTVLGIGLAVGGFSKSLQTGGGTPASVSATDSVAGQPRQPETPAGTPAGATTQEAEPANAYISRLKESLSDVTSGLAVAFDTTFLALVMSMIIMFPMSSMRKAEEDMLISVAEYCNENLLPRLYEGKKESLDQQRIKDAVASAIAAHEAELRVICKRLDATGDALVKNIVAGWETIHERMRDIYARQLNDLEALLGRLGEERRELGALSEAARGALRPDPETHAPTQPMADAGERPAALGEPAPSVLTLSGAGTLRREGWWSRLFKRKPRADGNG